MARTERGELFAMDKPQVVLLEDAEDDRLAAYVDLRHDSARPTGSHFIAEGRLLVQRLIDSRYEIESLLVSHGHENEFAGRLDPQVPIYSLQSDQLKQLVGYDFHRGVMACAKRQPPSPIEQFQWSDDDLPIALALVGISDPENLGGIFRSAAAFGIRHVLLGPQTLDSFSRRVLRVSMGNVLKLQLYQMDRPLTQLSSLHDRGIRSVATTLDSTATPLDRFATSLPEVSGGRSTGVLLMLGNEAEGLPMDIQQTASHRVTIPMRLNTDSLNVSVAAAVFMHWLARSELGE